MTGSNINSKPFPKTLRRLKSEVSLFGNLSSDIVRKSAVRIRDVCCPLKNNNLSVLTESAKPCGSGRPSGDPAYNTDLHLVVTVTVVTVFMVMFMVSAVTSFSIFMVMVVVMSAGCIRIIGECTV